MIAAGIVRPARRPPGWRAGGPPPAAPCDHGPRSGEDLCWLSGDWRILQRLDGHRWSLDDLVTAWVAAERLAPPARIADLGCGIGSVLMMLAWRFAAARCLGVEAQAVSVDLARRSLAWNGAEGRCEVRHGDLRDPTVVPEGAVFDLVTGTPPYLRAGTATPSTRLQCTPCRFTARGGFADYCRAAARLLTPDGRFVACEAAGRRAAVEDAAASAGLEIAQRLDVVPRAGKSPLLTVYELRRASTLQAPARPSTLVVRDEAGQRTAAFRAVRRAMGMPP
jgi:tRNA1Val (adenine37-N6)-methyltransferase